jgi:hypothetical protein
MGVGCQASLLHIEMEAPMANSRTAGQPVDGLVG